MPCMCPHKIIFIHRLFQVIFVMAKSCAPHAVFLANHKCEQFPDCDILNVVVIDRELGKKRMDEGAPSRSN